MAVLITGVADRAPVEGDSVHKSGALLKEL